MVTLGCLLLASQWLWELGAILPLLQCLGVYSSLRLLPLVDGPQVVSAVGGDDWVWFTAFQETSWGMKGWFRRFYAQQWGMFLLLGAVCGVFLGRMAVGKARERCVVFPQKCWTQLIKLQQRNSRKNSVLPFLCFSANFLILEGVGGLRVSGILSHLFHFSCHFSFCTDLFVVVRCSMTFVINSAEVFFWNK